jgi:hypothetical protein
MPCSKTAKIGVWENGRFIGAIIFAWGANLRLAGEYGLKLTECAELCRVALTDHETPVSRIVSISIKMLKRHCPGLRLLASYADPAQGHVGSIYQAMGWVYVGERSGTSEIMLNGKPTHRRTVSSKFKTSSVEWLRRHVDPQAAGVPTPAKHKYLLALDTDMLKQIKRLEKPYPKRQCASGVENDTPAVQAGEAGEIPSGALQSIACD